MLPGDEGQRRTTSKIPARSRLPLSSSRTKTEKLRGGTERSHMRRGFVRNSLWRRHAFFTEDVLFSGASLDVCHIPVQRAFKNPWQNRKDATDVLLEVKRAQQNPIQAGQASTLARRPCDWRVCYQFWKEAKWPLNNSTLKAINSCILDSLTSSFWRSCTSPGKVWSQIRFCAKFGFIVLMEQHWDQRLELWKYPEQRELGQMMSPSPFNREYVF